MLFTILIFIGLGAMILIPGAYLFMVIACAIDDDEETFWNLTKKFAFSVPLLIVLGLVIFKAPYTSEAVERYDILACQDTLGVKSTPHSRYYARINSEQYVVLAVGSTNNYVVWSLPTSVCQFYTTSDDTTPYVEKMQSIAYKGTILECPCENYTYNIHIPADTLVQDYSIDLK